MKNLKYEFVCSVCKKTKKTNQIRQKLCDEKCRKEFYGRQGRLNIATSSVGAISEMAICIEMLKRGYSVFRTVSQSSFCDVIAVKKKEILMMEVRTGYKDLSGNITFPMQFFFRHLLM